MQHDATHTIPRPIVCALACLALFTSGAFPGATSSASAEGPSPLVQLAQADDDLFGDDEDLFGDDEDLFGDDEDLFEDERPPAPPTPTTTQQPGGPGAGAPEAPRPSSGAPLPPTGIEELLITGSARQRREADVTDSVTQFNAEALKDLGATDIADLADVTPNLEIKTAGVGAPTFFSRGIGLSDFSSNSAGAIAIVQNGTLMNAPAVQLGLLFDIGNVEVLNGPQPGGPYRNASGGALVIDAASPSGDVGGFMRASGGNYSAQDYEGFLNLPLVDDLLYSRFSFRVQDRDGYYTNGCANAPPLAQRPPSPSVNNRRTEGVLRNTCGEANRAALAPFLKDEPFDTHVWAGRFQLRFLPTIADFETDFTIGVSGEFRDQGNQVPAVITAGSNPGVVIENPPPGVPANLRATNFLGTDAAQGYLPLDVQTEIFAQNRLADARLPAGTPNRPDAINSLVVPAISNSLGKRGDRRPYHIDVNRESTVRQNTWTGFLNSNIDFGDLTLGETDLGTLKFESTTSFNEYWRRRVSDNDGTPDVEFESNTGDKAWQLWHDMKLDGELNPDALAGPVDWETGFYYLQTKLTVDIRDFFRPNEVSSTRDYTQDTRAFGFYGRLEFTLGNFVVGGSARYNWERKVFDSIRVNQSVGTTFRDQKQATFTAPTGQVRLTYNIRDDISVFWKYSRGHKAGHFNSSSDPLRGVTDAGPEQIDAWETGLKGSFFDNRLRLSANLFYYEYKDYQLFIVEDSFDAAPQLEVQNAQQVEVYGAEAEIYMEPIERLRLTTRFGWLESQFVRFSDEVLRQISSDGFRTFQTYTVVTDFSGNRLPNSPQFSVNVSAEYELDMGNYGFVIPRYDMNWTDDVYFDREEGFGGANALGQRNLPQFALGQKDKMLHNVRLSYITPDRKIELAGWGRNITNEVYRITGFDASAAGVGVIHFLGEPRMFGGEIIYNW